jgi:hypothetical protein
VRRFGLKVKSFQPSAVREDKSNMPVPATPHVSIELRL